MGEISAFSISTLKTHCLLLFMVDTNYLEKNEFTSEGRGYLDITSVTGRHMFTEWHLENNFYLIYFVLWVDKKSKGQSKWEIFLDNL